MSVEAVNYVSQQMREGETFEQAVQRVAHNLDGMIRQTLALRKSYFVNCWHMFPTETAAMWKAYGKHDSAVAITSSVERISRALAERTIPIRCGTIDYIDFETTSVDVSNVLNVVMKKRLSFHSESEVRLVWWNTDLLYSNDGKDFASAPPPKGEAVLCSLHDLIDDIWISPTSPDWLAETMQSVCKLTGFETRVRRSKSARPAVRIGY